MHANEKSGLILMFFLLADTYFDSSSPPSRSPQKTANNLMSNGP